MTERNPDSERSEDPGRRDRESADGVESTAGESTAAGECAATAAESTAAGPTAEAPAPRDRPEAAGDEADPETDPDDGAGSSPDGSAADGLADGPEDGSDDRSADWSEDDEPRSRREAGLPLDEEAAWAEIVAAYGEEPDAGSYVPGGAEGPRDQGGGSGGEDGTPVRSFTVYAAGTGPRDWSLDGEDNEDDEGHFVPPEPPPLPQTDPTTKFAWIAVLGGPLLLFACILTQQPLTWWIITLGLGGFLGGFATLVARMRDGRDDDDWDDPGRGAVV